MEPSRRDRWQKKVRNDGGRGVISDVSPCSNLRPAAGESWNRTCTQVSAAGLTREAWQSRFTRIVSCPCERGRVRSVTASMQMQIVQIENVQRYPCNVPLPVPPWRVARLEMPEPL